MNTATQNACHASASRCGQSASSVAARASMVKGEESGNAQRVVEMRIDCDQDAVWLKVEQQGAEAACHTGRRTCFYRRVPLGGAPGAIALDFVNAERQFDPEDVYRHPGAAKGTLKK